MLFKTDVDFNGLKVFGYLCYASTLSTNRRKFDPRASKCVFIGFQRGTKGYILLNIQSREIFVCRDVVFYERVFHYQRVQDTSNETNSPDINDQILFVEDQFVLSHPSQAILAPCDNTPCDNTPCDNVENSSDNNCESQIEVSEEDCSHINQNLNEIHDIEQSSESDLFVRMSTINKKTT